jgi:hypothetical protein
MERRRRSKRSRSKYCRELFSIASDAAGSIEAD